jgi:pimeloyl-[acyl-carrier protein] methyl ester esterase
LVAADERVVVICLPGMDGTGGLFAAFAKAAPEWAQVVAVYYSTDKKLGYDALVQWAKEYVPADRDYLVIAESFSGPVGIGMCQGKPQRCLGLVLVNTFVTPPGGGAMGYVPWNLIFAMPVIESAAKLVLMAGPSETPVKELTWVISGVKTEVMAYRAGLIAELDARDALARVQVPVMVLRGLDDHVVGLAKAQEIKECKGDAQLREIPGPHLLLQARPQEAWKEIKAFLDGK